MTCGRGFASRSWHCLVIYFWDRWPAPADKLSWEFQPPPRSTKPCIPAGSLNRVPASAGVRRESHRCRVAGNTVWSHMACDFSSGVVKFTNCYTLFTYLTFTVMHCTTLIINLPATIITKPELIKTNYFSSVHKCTKVANLAKFPHTVY